MRTNIWNRHLRNRDEQILIWYVSYAQMTAKWSHELEREVKKQLKSRH